MATKVKPTRLQITGTPQSGDVPMYVNADCFCRGQGGGGSGTVVGPSSSCDGDLAIFCGTCGDCIVDSGEKLCDYAKCCDMPNMSCYQQVCNLVCDLAGADNTHYPSAKAVADAIQSAGGGDMLKSVYDPNNCNADAFDYCNFSNTPDLNCYQEKLTAGNNITINANTISGDFNYATSSTAAACTTKCVCIPEITQLCVGQQITVKPSVTATNCATSLKLNDFAEYPIRFNNAALTSTTDGYIRGADCLSTFLFDGSYWQVASKSYDINTTYTLNTLLDAGKYTAGTGTYALSRYSLVMEKDDGTWEKITNTSAAYSTATTKTVNTNGFRLNHIRYYNTTTNVATGALIATNTLANQAASVDLRYSTNCGGTTTFAEGDYIYLVGTIKSDGLFYLDTTTWWTNTLPTANDGKLYIRIGLCLAANGYTTSFLVDRPIFYYDNGIKVYGQADNKQDVISDLDTIRTGAACGATAAQPSNIACINGCCLTNGGNIVIGGFNPFGDGSDGSCTITTDTVLCAKEYNFNNLTICNGVTVCFCGDGLPIIRATNKICNLGIIKLSNPTISDDCYIYSSTLGQIGVIKNTSSIGSIDEIGGNGGYADSLCCGGNGGGIGVGGGNGCNSGGAGGAGGACAGGGGGGGGSGGMAGCNATDNIGGNGGNGGAGSNYSAGGGGGGGGYGLCGGGNGGNGGDRQGLTNGTYGGSGGGGGNSCFGNAGNGGNGGGGKNCDGGNGGNGGCSKCGLGGNGGNGGGSHCGNGGNGGNGGIGLCGGNGGKGGNASISNKNGGNGGNGGDGFLAGGNGGNGGNGGGGSGHCGNGGNGGSGGVAGNGGCGYIGGNGGNSTMGVYGIGIFANNIISCCIDAQGGNGGDGGYGSACGGNGGNGSKGGEVHLLYGDCIEQQCTNVSGGNGGSGGGGGVIGSDGCKGDDGLLHIQTLIY